MIPVHSVYTEGKIQINLTFPFINIVISIGEYLELNIKQWSVLTFYNSFSQI